MLKDGVPPDLILPRGVFDVVLIWDTLDHTKFTENLPNWTYDPELDKTGRSSEVGCLAIVDLRVPQLPEPRTQPRAVLTTLKISNLTLSKYPTPMNPTSLIQRTLPTTGLTIPDATIFWHPKPFNIVPRQKRTSLNISRRLRTAREWW